jgi:serine/threonine-protein kinase
VFNRLGSGYLSVVADEPQPGDVLGPYRIEEVLGRGATGTVYRAVRPSDGETVALKVLRAELARDDEYSRRFLHEARAAREVEHRHVVRVLDAGTAEGRHFLAMAYVRGTSLAHRLATEGPLPLSDVLRLAAEVGAALDALHVRGVVHRDVKPSNVLRDEGGAAVLTDFGIAKGRAYTVLTRPGQILGTVDFLAPEVIRGDGATSASDIYGLGCVVFACLAGTAPFASASALEAMVGHLGSEPPDPGAGRDDVPAGFSDAVLRALAKDPGARPRTGKAYALALWRSATGSS